MILAIPYPNIDPVLFSIGPLIIRWYALAYIFGLLLAWWYARWLVSRSPHAATKLEVDDFITWAMIGVVLGGRIGYVLFYKFDFYLSDPMAALRVWEGGMSFHGGLIGSAVAGILFAKRRGIRMLPFADVLFSAAPIGLFLGRLANFINGELYGRVTDVSWAFVFPRGGNYPRHPSQLYEAALEGVVLFIVLHLLWRSEAVRNRPGILSGVFLLGYGLSRAIVEVFRQPDVHLGFLLGGSTMGQWLSAPMVALGLYLIIHAMRHKRQDNAKN